MNGEADHILFKRIKKSDQRAFEALFRTYYPFLCLYATRLIKDAAAAEEIVQELFIRLWEKRTDVDIETSVKNYLFRAVKNYCLNHIKHIKVKDEYFRKIQLHHNIEQSVDFEWDTDLMQKIEEGIASLPEKRREIFKLSRLEGLKYREIADRLNVSIKTVETQMGIAIKTLRIKLRDYLPFFL